VEGFENKQEILDKVKECLAARARAGQASLRNQDDDMESMTVTDALDQAAFVITSNLEVVGLVIARAERNMDYLSRHFGVEEYVSVDHLNPVSLKKEARAKEIRKHELELLKAPKRETAQDRADERLAASRAKTAAGKVEYFLLNPLLQKKTNFILREVLRIYRKKILFYYLYPNSLLQNLTDSLVQLRPRRIPVQSKDLVVKSNPKVPPIQDMFSPSIWIKIIKQNLFSINS